MWCGWEWRVWEFKRNACCRPELGGRPWPFRAGDDRRGISLPEAIVIRKQQLSGHAGSLGTIRQTVGARSANLRHAVSISSPNHNQPRAAHSLPYTHREIGMQRHRAAAVIEIRTVACVQVRLGWQAFGDQNVV